MNNIFTAVLASLGKLPLVSLAGIAEKLPDIIHAVVALLGAVAALAVTLSPLVPINLRPAVEAVVAFATTAAVWLASKKVESLVNLVVAAADRIESPPASA